MRSTLIQRLFLSVGGVVMVLPLFVHALVLEHPLSLGSTGSDVSNLQQFLRDEGYFSYPHITGYFGVFTRDALRRYQSAHGFEPVGAVGPKTRAMINAHFSSLASGQTSVNPFLLPAGFGSETTRGQSVESHDSTTTASSSESWWTTYIGDFSKNAPGNNYQPGFGGGSSPEPIRVQDTAPTFTSTDTISIPEGTTTVAKIVASDAKSRTIRYAIAGGADANKFVVDPDSGALSFVSPPSFGNPTDSGNDNTYDVIVKADNGALSSTQSESVTVTYQAKAVYFDGAAFLSNPALVSNDNGYVSFSVWVKYFDDQTGLPVWESSVADYLENGFTSGGLLPQQRVFLDTKDYEYLESNVVTNKMNVWYHYLFTAQTNLPSGTKILKLYRNDTDVTGSIDSDSDSFIAPINGKDFYVGGTGEQFSMLKGYIADIWVAPGQSLADTNGDIPTSTRRKFIDSNGNPVDLGSDCSKPTGISPAVCFSGGSSAFVTNRGTGGAFALTGALVDATSTPNADFAEGPNTNPGGGGGGGHVR